MICGERKRLTVSNVIVACLDSKLKRFFTVYFKSGSPDFMNSRGRLINASDQISALAQAQSIGNSNRQCPRSKTNCTTCNHSKFTSPYSLFSAST